MAQTPNTGEVARHRTVKNQITPAPRLAAFDGPPTGRFAQRALQHLRSISGAEGLPAEFEVDPTVHRTSSGAVAVHAQQQFKSIPIFTASQTVRFAPDGLVEGAIGNAVTIDSDLPVEPQVSVTDAAAAAVRHVTSLGDNLLGETDEFGNALAPERIDASKFSGQVIATFPDMPQRPAVLDGGPLGSPVKASLVWFPTNEDVRLAWSFNITMPKGTGQYRVIVSARNGDILYSRQLVDLVAGRGRVYRVDGSQREQVDFPQPWTTYGLSPLALPPAPDDWLEGLTTSGNIVHAHLGDTGIPITGVNAGGVVTLDPTDATGDDQKVLNIFYFNCVMHDLFYMLGFREADGNFQQDNRGRGGIPGDRVDARAHSQAVWGTANMFTPPDGTAPTMNMGLVTATGRHTAFDSSVVFHEYMHGVTNRLVGGPTNDHALDEPQSKSMGEGWGDYIACTVNGTATVGSWVMNNPNGIRSARYDENYPGKFGDIGTGVYVQPHRVGEIWCATLLQINRNLDTLLGAPRGRNLALQLVVDALKLSPANPSMLDMRDAILKALDNQRSAPSGALTTSEFQPAMAEVWKAFAKFGMGLRAASSGAKFEGVSNDFTVPPTTPSTDSGIGGGTSGSTTGTVSTPTSTAGGTLRLNDPVATPIPDGDTTGISRNLNCEPGGTIRRVIVHIDIRHTYPGDLQITLISPEHRSVVLHNRAFIAGQALTRDYTPEDTPALSALAGQNVQGLWTLKVADLSTGDTGTLQKWGLELEVAGALNQPSGFDMGGAPATATALVAGSDLNALIKSLRDTVAKLDHILAGNR
jgi:extracellular elastinolytic metalloproteinase